ncbi:hypothetical protein LOC67_27035 [Stieleria sp. JC731]|uniref:hypothetical protein n=1 Tax=Stieleria sp. JC731 TaxID=2894195 RepID=UPI001E530BEB|nr:hypothetical protein [Stieleria sp. JC731]MCC9604225.1 hypothetical protein [Stieleria sp. JC731]
MKTQLDPGVQYACLRFIGMMATLLGGGATKIRANRQTQYMGVANPLAVRNGRVRRTIACTGVAVASRI